MNHTSIIAVWKVIILIYCFVLPDGNLKYIMWPFLACAGKTDKIVTEHSTSVLLHCVSQCDQ